MAGTEVVKINTTVFGGAWLGVGVACKRRRPDCSSGCARRRVPAPHWALSVIHDEGTPAKSGDVEKATSSCASVLGLWADAHDTPMVVREMADTV